MRLRLPKKLTYREYPFKSHLGPFEVFERILGKSDHAFILESLGRESNFSRFTHIGFNPISHVKSRGHHLTIDGTTQRVENPYETLRTLFPVKLKRPGFAGGLVGYFSHEATKYFEPSLVLPSHSDFPDFEFGLYLDGLTYDKKIGTFVYFTLDKDRREHIHAVLKSTAGTNPLETRELGSNKTKIEYQRMFSKAKQEIRAGNIFQLVLSVKFQYACSGQTLALYKNLREINPSPHMYYLKFGERQIIGASPELLIRVKGKHLEHFGTLAGTIGRGKSKREDILLEKKLQKDPKERAEHMMLVDLARNDVGKVCSFGSIKVKKILSVKKYSHVQHLYSEITGTLNSNEDSFSALKACFPAGTLTGAPKIEAIKLITNIEGEPRGPYGGVVGYFSLSGDCMFAITIRTIFVSGNKAYTQVGSGIVYDSTHIHEYREILSKHAQMHLAVKRHEDKYL